MTRPALREMAFRPLRPRRRKAARGEGDRRRKPAQGGGYNVEALTDRTGQIVERYEYSPYGEPTVYTGKGADGKWYTSDDVTAAKSARGNDALFQGRQIDWESGMYYYRARMYSPGLGRFVSRDPIRFAGGDWNFYRFVNNNPIMSLDPSGLVTTDLDISPKNAVRFVPRSWITNGRADASGRGMTQMYATADCKCSGTCDKKYSMACALKASIRIYLADLTDPIWQLPDFDSRYGNTSHSVMSRVSDVLSHEGDHFRDFGWLTRWFINRLADEESKKYDQQTQCESRATRIPGKVTYYIRKMNDVSERFDQGSNSGGGQWDRVGPPPGFGNSW